MTAADQPSRLTVQRNSKHDIGERREARIPALSAAPDARDRPRTPPAESTQHTRVEDGGIRCRPRRACAFPRLQQNGQRQLLDAADDRPRTALGHPGASTRTADHQLVYALSMPSACSPANEVPLPSLEHERTSSIVSPICTPDRSAVRITREARAIPSWMGARKQNSGAGSLQLFDDGVATREERVNFVAGQHVVKRLLEGVLVEGLHLL